MTEVKCSIKDCTEVFRTPDPVSPEIRFICRHHPRDLQLRQVGRSLRNKDLKDKDVRFQAHQFDSNLKGGGKQFQDNDD